jgi:hypothetical protein
MSHSRFPLEWAIPRNLVDEGLTVDILPWSSNFESEPIKAHPAFSLRVFARAETGCTHAQQPNAAPSCNKSLLEKFIYRLNRA